MVRHSPAGAYPIVDRTGKVLRNQYDKAERSPVSIATPIAIIATPAASLRIRPARLNLLIPETRKSVNSVDSKNGIPSPREYTPSRNIPSATDDEVAPTVRMAPRIGPIHGVHPNAKASPNR